MNRIQQAHQFSLASWASRFQEQKASGLTIKAWCAQNNISIHTYNYWKHLVKQEYLDAILPPALPEIVPVSPASLPDVSNPLVTDNTNRSNESRDSSDPHNLSGSNAIKIELPGIYIHLDSLSCVEMTMHILKAVYHA